MFDYLRERGRKAGQPPGAVIYVGDHERSAPVGVSVLTYAEGQLQHLESATLDQAAALLDPGRVTWIDVDGVHDTELVTRAGELFGLHPLVLEDISHTAQRPKLEDAETSLFVVVRMLRYDQAARRVRDEQLSLILGPHWLLSFQEEAVDVFGDVRQRVLSGRTRIRALGADYLLYALLDAVIDGYFLVLERLGERIQEIEEALLDQASPVNLEALHSVRREVLFLRKWIWPLREVIGRLERGESDLVRRETTPYLRDLYDHTVQVMDTVETFRDMLAGLTDLHVSNVSLKLNQIMKVLTIISTLFIPLSFLTGLYGMNFQYMPELTWHWGYFGLLGLMAGIVGVMLWLFRRNDWL